MHVFIDTNILLSFYHFTSDDLDALNNVFVSHKRGKVTLYLTDQVRDEFARNRENRVFDALKRFKDANIAVQLPNFMKVYPEYEKLQKITKSCKKRHSALLAKAEHDIKARRLAADELIENMFKKSSVFKTTQKTYLRARRRVEVGNPPGKNGSIGDAINWLLLLEHVPSKEKLYLITDDRDFYSMLDDGEINPFLGEEWKRERKSTVQCYRTLGAFLKDHYDGVSLSFDPEKKALIDGLESSRNFATTHALIAKLEEFKYFSLQEVKSILDAAVSNNQFGYIVGDDDVKKFVARVIVPYVQHVSDRDHKRIIASAE